MKKVCIFMIAVCCAFAHAEEHSKVLRYFNGKTLGFVYVDSISQFRDDISETGIGKVWAEPEVRAFLAGPLQKLDGLVKQGSAKTGFDLNKIWDMCIHAEGGTGLSLMDIDIDKEYPKMVFVMTGIREEDREFAAQNISRLEQLVLQNPTITVSNETVRGRKVKVLRDAKNERSPDVYCFAETDEIIIGLSREAFVQALDNFEKKKIEPYLASSLKVCGLPARGGIFGFVHAQSVIALIRKVMEEEGAREDEKKIFNEFHFEDIAAVALHSSVKGPGFYNRFFIDLTGRNQGIGKFFTDGTLNPELIKEVPEKASGFSAADVDLAALWDAVMDMMKRMMDEKDFQQVQAVIAGVEMQLGLKIRNELLASLTGEFLVYQSMPMIAMQVPESVIKIKLNDNAPVTKLMHNFLIPALQQKGLKINDVVMGNFTAKMVQIPKAAVMGFVPGFLITDRELIIASTPTGIQAGLVRPASSVLNNIEYAKLDEYVNAHKASSVSFADVKKSFSTFYPLLGSLFHFVPNAARITGLEMSKIPLTQTIAQHLIGMRSWAGKVDGDVLAEIYGPVDYITTGTVLTAGGAMLAWIRVQEDVGRATVAKVEVSKKNRLQELFNACNLYMLDHKGDPPAKLSDLYPDYVMDITVFGEKGLTKETIDPRGMFVLVPGVTFKDKGKIMLYERFTPETQNVIAIRVDENIIEMSVEQLKAALQKQSEE